MNTPQTITEPQTRTDTLMDILVATLRGQGVLGVDALRFTVDGLDADLDDDGGWWWTGDLIDEAGETIGTLSAPDWYPTAMEINWT